MTKLDLTFQLKVTGLDSLIQEKKTFHKEQDNNTSEGVRLF